MLIIGCGYVGQALGIRLAQAGRAVTGTTTTEAGLAALRQAGITPLLLNLDTAGPTINLREHNQIFYLAPPPGDGVTDPRMSRFLECRKEPCSALRLIYMSTTGVYGDCGGEWVTEARPTHATTDRAQRRLDGETRLLEWRARTGAEVVILRVAGIYGPGRLPVDRIRSGAPMVRADEAPWSNRIHVDDLVSVCLAAMAKGKDGEVYNVSDGMPGTMSGYFAAVAAAAGLPRPPAISMAEAQKVLSPGLLSYLAENRRIDNGKLLSDLGVTLKYGDLAAGIRASLP